MATRPIRFFHRGQVHEVADLPTTTTVLQWLREQAHEIGCKEGCAEGDCGACTVLVGELKSDDALALKPVNACIQFLPTLDGRALLTVEDLGPGDRLNPVQQAMVDCHGSQCGFCTPGFTMTLQGVYERHQACKTRPSRQELADELAGNLCRCTGYRPILDAGERMFDAPARPIDRAPIVEALQQLQSDAPLDFSAPSLIDAKVESFHVPRTVEALAALRQQKPDARMVAGATDVGLWVNKQMRRLGDVIYLGQVRELQFIEERGSELWIGAGVTLEDAWAAMCQSFPALRQLWLRFASPPVRNAGTLGGNIANGSPIGDGPPALMALDASIHLRQGQRQRRMPLRDFYLDYMKNAMEAGEFVEGLSIPLSQVQAGTTEHLRAYKISKRYDSDISAVCAVFSMSVKDGRVAGVRLAFGGMAATVKRAAVTEATLHGQVWDEATLAQAIASLPQDFKPLSDLRASAAYRMQVAQNLLRRFWMETRSDAPLLEHQVNVWLAADFNRSLA